MRFEGYSHLVRYIESIYGVGTPKKFSAYVIDILSEESLLVIGAVRLNNKAVWELPKKISKKKWLEIKNLALDRYWSIGLGEENN